MTEFAVAIPTCAGREENLKEVLRCLGDQMIEPRVVILACDGEDAHLEAADCQFPFPAAIANLSKHEPGLPQPRNMAVKALERLGERFADVTHIAFLDSDILVEDSWLAEYEMAIAAGGPEGIYYGPYDWMGPGARQLDPTHPKNDPRWAMFEAHESGVRYTNDLSKGLGCFSGNLVWNIEDFKRVGGFWNELHHGRCEDGELGLRATAMGVPIGLVPEARGWHMYHDINTQRTLECNARDVPLINERHPWVEGEDVFVVEEDGKRFNCRCHCGWEGNTALIWKHQAECSG